MQTSGLPTRISIPFANSGKKNTIPVDSQIGITAGAASFTDGFPPLTMTSVSAGGVPPYGADFNGILNSITAAIRWSTAGSGYPFDSDFASSVAGYPAGALIPASDYSGYWFNTVDANSTSPENSTADTTGWVPGINYGVTSITGLSGSSVTLTTLQAAKSRITLDGTLTSNINIIFPAWIRNWTVVNNCTGNFSVTCTTASGSGVAVPAGVKAVIYCDGVNITTDTTILITPLVVFNSSGTFTCLYTGWYDITGTGGGGGGGGCKSASTSDITSGAGGGAGGTFMARLFMVAGKTYDVTVGSGGSGGVGATSGSTGSTTSFGSLYTAAGGVGGIRSTSSAQTTGGDPGTATGGDINLTGGYGMSGQTSAYIFDGNGGQSFFGGGGRASGNGINGLAAGSGGGGARDVTFSNTAATGGSGANGILIVRYAHE